MGFEDGLEVLQLQTKPNPLHRIPGPSDDAKMVLGRIAH